MSVSPPSVRRPPARPLYWLCQLAGWGLWCGLGLAMARQQLGRLNADVITGYALFFVFAIIVSHALRAIILRRGWLELAPSAGIARLAGAALVLGVVLTAFVVLVALIQHGASSDFTQPRNVLQLAANLTFGAAAWTTLYASLTNWLRQRGERLRAEALERSLAAARIQALEAQISPHFLFNCLNSLRGMISENPAQAQDMVTRLANILRQNLTRTADAATETLAQQVDLVSDYLALESVRFDERLRTRFEIDPTTRECAVPAMVLQTLVENALKHGIAHRPDGGEVLLRSRFVDGGLEIVVENSGTLQPAPAGSTQVGLANARERLRLLHGTAASLELRALPGERVQAQLRLPRLHSAVDVDSAPAESGAPRN